MEGMCHTCANKTSFCGFGLRTSGTSLGGEAVPAAALRKGWFGNACLREQASRVEPDLAKTLDGRLCAHVQPGLAVGLQRRHRPKRQPRFPLAVGFVWPVVPGAGQAHMGLADARRRKEHAAWSCSQSRPAAVGVMKPLLCAHLCQGARGPRQSVLVARWFTLLAHAVMSNLDVSLPPFGKLLADSSAGPPSASRCPAR